MAVDQNAVLQYIGARYVPKFYENPDTGDATWKSGVAYEGLTVVTYQQNSYTSKIPVPATVGDPASNGEYWVKTADWNAQLNALQNAVSNNTANIEELQKLQDGEWLKNKNVVAYGDSTIRMADNYLKLACNIAGATLVNRSRSGTRMCRGTNNGYDLIAADNDLTNFDVIFLCYGTNEWQTNSNAGDIQTDTRQIIEEIANISPAIEIVFCLPTYSYRNFNHPLPNYNNRGLTIKEVNELIENVLRNEYSVPVINFYNRSSVNAYNYTALLENSSGIYVHPLPVLIREQAAIVLSGADSNNYYGAETYENILNTYDFGLAQRYFTDAMVTANNNQSSGLNLYIASGTTWRSGYKTLQSNVKYKVSGVVNTAIDIVFRCVDDSSKSFRYSGLNGIFNMIATPPITGTYYVTVEVASSNATITDFAIRAIGYNINNFAASYNGGRPIKAKLISADITQTRDLKYFYGNNNINFMSAIFTVTNAISTGTELFNIDDGFDMTDIYFVAYQQTTVDGATRKIPHILAINNNKIVNGEPLQAGTYTICQISIPIPSNYRTSIELP